MTTNHDTQDPQTPVRLPPKRKRPQKFKAAPMPPVTGEPLEPSPSLLRWLRI